MTEVETILADHSFFKGIDPIHLRILGGCAASADFGAGELIFRQGEAANRFYIICHGKVALEYHTPTRGATIIETLGDHEILGASWLFPPYRWHWDARTLEATATIAFNAKCLREICEEDHDLGFELMKRFSAIISKRLQSARLQCLDVYGAPVTGK
jgi:CRP/FNR family transcriptional regulator, cyclic AMP receptor protein